MDILRKLLNPFGKGDGKKHQYQDLSKESKQVSSVPPSKILLYARDIAGVQIQQFMSILNNCRWLRAEYTYPAFDSMNFIYKNKIFSVIIDIQDENGISYLPDNYIKRQLLASRQHNLVPCKFPVTVDNPHNPDLSTAKALNKGWNLFHTETGEPIIPEHLATTEKVLMSEWEMRNFAIIFTRKHLEAKKMKILSFQDTLEVDPQLWFVDSNGNKCWAVVRCAKSPEKEAQKPKQLNEIIRRCFKNNGYFAGLVLIPQDIDADGQLYRGANVKIEFTGLEKIHSVL
ncbi:MAG: hypothetical protein LUB59_07620 [Candidatus Gastranaerophilales bacterium]|nr:hypothetical protein [Candidatus Gastranaerophilales bacterium]